MPWESEPVTVNSAIARCLRVLASKPMSIEVEETTFMDANKSGQD